MQASQFICWNLYHFSVHRLIFFWILCSNGSWRSVWNIEFKDEVQVLVIRGKIQVFFVNFSWSYFDLYALHVCNLNYLIPHPSLAAFFPRLVPIILKREMFSWMQKMNVKLKLSFRLLQHPWVLYSFTPLIVLSFIYWEWSMFFKALYIKPAWLWITYFEENICKLWHHGHYYILEFWKWISELLIIKVYNMVVVLHPVRLSVVDDLWINTGHCPVFYCKVPCPFLVLEG